jgi:hypothetical protein
MSLVVFAGPTIASDTVRGELTADVRGPAARGDVARAALDRPDAILVIDGYFDRVPSVWHKEILWAMSQGIHVFGAASMGALRAAELAEFGMVGVGEVYQAFVGGDLEDDDEVAVAHGDAASGYRRMSDAMVNIRWTLRAAERDGVIGTNARVRLEGLAKAMPYDQRDLRLVLGSCARDVLPAPKVAALQAWLQEGTVDQKHIDAVALLRHVAVLESKGWKRKSVTFRFAETDGWAALLAEVEGSAGRRLDRSADPGIEDELRARGMLGPVLGAATTRLLAADRLKKAGVTLNARAVEAWVDDFRREHGLYSEADFDAWLATAELDGSELEEFFRRESVVRATRREFRSAIGGALEDELRATGQLREVSSLAARKAIVLASHGLESPSLKDVGLAEVDLWGWFFRERLGSDTPSSIEAYAAQQGSTVDEIRMAALRDFAFERLTAGEARPISGEAGDGDSS